MYPDIVLAQQRHQELLDQAARDRLTKRSRASRPRRRRSGLFTTLLRNPEASAASAARRENPA